MTNSVEGDQTKISVSSRILQEVTYLQNFCAKAKCYIQGNHTTLRVINEAQKH